MMKAIKNFMNKPITWGDSFKWSGTFLGLYAAVIGACVAYEKWTNYKAEKDMKKLFISCPMKDRTEAQIRGTMMQMHNIAEAVFGEELDVIQTYIPDPPSGTNQALWCLAECIKMLSEADYFIGVYDEEKAYRGCAIENQAAKAYGIPSYTINLNYVARDVVEARAKEARKYSCFGY